MSRRSLAACLGVLISVAAYAAGGGPPAASVPGASMSAVPGELGEVMRLLARRRHGEVSFVEQRFLSLLKRPSESSGELIYDAPDRLEKRTLEPRPETLLVEGNVLTVQRGRHRQVTDMSSSAPILAFVDSIRATLAGDQAALARTFRLEFTGDVAHWSLVLFPLDAGVAKSVSQVRLDGAADALLEVEIRQPDGDRSLMTLRARSDP